jgi:hypothetical protein
VSSWRRLVTFAHAGSCVSLFVGCNAILGIHPPEDWDAAAELQIDSGARSDGSERTAVDGGRATHPFAEWPMPNPPSTNLPNPQVYDASQEPGVVVDAVTGLEWQRNVDPGTLDWSGAASYCARVAMGGGGFRLPSRIELLSLVDFTKSGPLIDATAFPDTPSNYFWTSSPVAADPSQAWSVYFGFGTTIASPSKATSSYDVRCVRQRARSASTDAGEPPREAGVGRYELHDGTVRDTGSRLTWQLAIASTPLSWGDARDYCGSLDFAGGGWRLPSVSELATLIDETTAHPAIDLGAFAGTPSEYFWTSSLLTNFETYAWTVYLWDGLSTFFDVAEKHRVRCVR